MKTLRLAFHMMLRDLRTGELHLLGLAIVIAVASLTSVGFLADRVGRALDREANQLLGGDLLLSADRPWPASFIAAARERGLTILEMSRTQKQQLVTDLAGDGAFGGRNAAAYISRVLGLGRATVYNYLRKKDQG